MESAVQTAAGAITLKKVSIAKDFSETPGGRSERDGPHNGRRFREKFLEPAVRDHIELVIDLDGVAGLPGSFCDEAFGALVRSHHLSRDGFYSIFKFEGRGADFKVNVGMVRLNVDRALKDNLAE